MRIEFDTAKRDATLEARGIDMADAGEVFSGPRVTFDDDRKDYGEPRKITIGLMSGRIVVLIWTPRGAVRRIISLRKANDRGQEFYGPYLR
jgi:uncharacterized DUF497 family protein